MWDDIFDDIAAHSQRNGTLPRPTPELLTQVWPTLAGDALAAISRPLGLEDGVLSLEVRERHLIDEWRASPQILLRRLRRFCPWKIETLDFVHNPRLRATTPAAHTRPSAPVEDRPTDGASSVDSTPRSAQSSRRRDVEDPELQDLIDSISRYRALHDET